jgi:Kef-type K+ transport system membrane component KefB
MDLIVSEPFYEIATLILFASVVGLMGLVLRQPLIVAFIGVGILAGPSVLNLVQSTRYISLMSEMSIAILLFLVGLKLDVKLVRSLGSVALATGLGQVAFTVVIGFVLCLAMGMAWVPSLYVAVALTFSSTIIIVKLLSDKREVDSLHGRIALGFLIVQDLVVVLAMVVLSGIGVGTQAEDAMLVTGVGLLSCLLVAYLFMRFVAERLLRYAAQSQELILVLTVGWAAGLGAVGHALGFGMELGGLLAGVTFAGTTYRDAISAKLSGLRDFLLLFFFLGLGASLNLSTLGSEVARASVLSVFVLVGNPLIVIVIMMAMGYRHRTGFLAGLTVAQISEFSLVFMAMGVSLGHVHDRYLGLVTLVGLITIAASTYMITYSHQLYDAIGRFIPGYRRASAWRETVSDSSDQDGNLDILVVGMGRFGSAVAELLAVRGYRVGAVDFDPRALEQWRAAGRVTVYADVTDTDVVAHLPLQSCRAVLVSLPSERGVTYAANPSAAFVQAIRSHGYQGRVFVVERDSDRGGQSWPGGVDSVIRPYVEAATVVSDRIAGALA